MKKMAEDYRWVRGEVNDMCLDPLPEGPLPEDPYIRPSLRTERR